MNIKAAQVRRNLGTLYSSPMALWFTLFFLAPIIIIIIFSFLRKGLHGGVVQEFSIEAYRYLADPVFLRITFRTLVTSLIATVITILIALPCGYAM
ncbi:MAG: ABC transporter permease, partial [Treponema sp.]|nr:ABC transporter permease [Treponema sp.]